MKNTVISSTADPMASHKPNERTVNKFNVNKERQLRELLKMAPAFDGRGTLPYDEMRETEIWKQLGTKHPDGSIRAKLVRMWREGWAKSSTGAWVKLPTEAVATQVPIMPNPPVADPIKPSTHNGVDEQLLVLIGRLKSGFQRIVIEMEKLIKNEP